MALVLEMIFLLPSVSFYIFFISGDDLSCFEFLATLHNMVEFLQGWLSLPTIESAKISYCKNLLPFQNDDVKRSIA